MLNLLHVEVCQNVGSLLTEFDIKKLVQTEFDSLEEIILNKPLLSENFSTDALKTHVQSIYCSCEQEQGIHVKLLKETIIKIYVYRLNQEDIAIETIHKDGEEISAAAHWMLPSDKFFGLWENLFYDPGVKEKLVNFVETAMVYSERQVNPHIISWNKVILLHGPPGTGKTSLCKALAQKITIRLGHKFTRGELIEINSHSLFSKWFSESGKLVMNIFNEIKILLQDPKALIFILIDEIESLAHARKACTTGSEPSDSIRVVNALLTQLDNIKQFPNVLILTTSNLTEVIDVAFVDRADIKLYISLPNEQAIYSIYSNCVEELMRTNFIRPEKIHDMEYLKRLNYEENSESKNSLTLYQLSCKSINMSGRTLKKIPFLAHALYNQARECSLHEFLMAMNFAIQWQTENSLK
ncbi:PREDICTED: pachytene checkpoint protein 2 homolog [Ceratosolen solmsi marchali]|uniref:Pachytene checkpoint protein 2 homolog n=1 Tax=Ceratosolen solmsi marchali TaxID=326594 RepID=A0AAJ6YC63_9HYME|nr:PREDICTED: pachytene checkpoint protein 2 homolog [Ceratosolen solmsi marchali]